MNAIFRIVLLPICFLLSSQLFAQPTISSFSPASGPVGSLITIVGTNLSNPTSISIGGVSAVTVSSKTDTLVALVMPGATTGNISVTNLSGTINSASSFTITAGGLPTSQQGSQLVGITIPNDPINGKFSFQGYSVALSADGNTAIVGGYADSSYAGAAWIYTRNAGTWKQQGTKLVGNGTAGNAQQGFSVAISADGNTAVIGGNKDNNGTGAIWVFTRSSGLWNQQGAKLVATDTVGTSLQGNSVSISADGNTIAVGGHNTSIQGATWIFTRTAGVWAQQGSKLIGTGGSGIAYTNWSVALSADGNTVLTGAFGMDNGLGGGQGVAWVFTRTSGVWTQQGPLLSGSGILVSGTTKAAFGISVGLSADGNTAIVGGYADNAYVGAAWIFSRSGNVWSQQGDKLVGTYNIGPSWQGNAVAISGDGNTVLVGGPQDSLQVGAVWLYKRNNGSWLQQGSKLTGTKNTAGAYFGTAVALSADGQTGFVGGYTENNSQGAAWAFTTPPAPSNISFTPASASVGSLVTITGTNLADPVSLNIGGVPAILVSADSSKITALVMPGATTGIVNIATGGGSANANSNITIIDSKLPNTQQGPKLVGTNHINGTNEGSAVAISADGNTAIVGGNLDNNIGAAWIYTKTAGVWSQQSKLIGTGYVTGSVAINQGKSVGISADGNTAIIGGIGDNNGIGAAWIFVRNGSTWTQQTTKLIASDNAGASAFGSSVALNADGNTAVIGGTQDSSGVGAVWIFTRSRGVWRQQGAKILGNNNIGVGSNQGSTVAINADGNTILFSGSNMSSVWAFTRSLGVWQQQGNKLTVTDSIGKSSFGSSIALSSDGNTAVIGGNTDSVSKGAVWVFTRTLNTWAQQGNKLVGTGTSILGQGTSVAISANGNALMSSGYSSSTGKGVLWQFTRTGNVWSEQYNALMGTADTNYQSHSIHSFNVAMSADGNTSMLGMYWDASIQGATLMMTHLQAAITQKDTAICVGASLSLTGSSNGYYKKVLWSTGDTTNTIVVKPSVNSTYYYTVTDSFTLATSTDSIHVSMNIPPVPNITAGSSSTICAGDNVILTSSVVTGLQWLFNKTVINGAVGVTDTVKVAGNYAAVSTFKGCLSDTSNTVTVVVNALPPIPTITNSRPLSFCSGDSTILNTNATAGIQWNINGSTSATDTLSKLTVAASGSYKVTVKNAAGCTASSTFDTVISKALPLLPKVTPLNYCVGVIADSLTATPDASNSLVWYSQSTGGTALTHSPIPSTSAAGSTNYYVSQKNPATGCEGTRAYLTVQVIANPPVPSITNTSNQLVSSASTYYHWYFDNVIVDNIYTNSLNVFKKGLYKVSTSTDSVCWSSSDGYLVLADPPSTNQNDYQLVVYPNPASTLFYADIKLTNSYSGIIQLTLVDINGTTQFVYQPYIFNQSRVAIPINFNLNKQVYVLQVQINGYKTQTVKIIGN
jgi:hypothetical protein